MISHSGNIVLAAALLLSIYSLVISFVGQRNEVPFLKRSAHIAFYFQTFMLIAASMILLIAFVGDHFEIEYVFSYSCMSQALLYKIVAFYAGRDGSLLFWAVLLAVFSLAYIKVLKKTKRDDLYEVLTVLAFIQVFFNLMLYFQSNPFSSFDFTPADGRGMNPLLENFYMIVHPPSLYIGFIMFTVPFAQGVISLHRGDSSGDWIEKTRLWILWAWFFLGLGNVLGSYWAYIELGWGGYWAWDPVENASFIPWLVSTALLHSIISQKKMGMLVRWNYFLVFLTFILTIVATFLTRSGIVSSVHAFAKSGIGNYFLIFIFILALACFGLLVKRSRRISVGRSVEFFSSREAFFVALNIIFIFSGLAVLIGTLLPAFTEILINKKITLEISYYNRIFSLIGIMLLFGFGFCPLLKWRKGFKAYYSFPVFGYLTIVIVLALVAIRAGERSVLSILSYAFSAGAIFTTGYVIYNGIKSSFSSQETTRRIFANLRRYGGMLAHVGVILMIVGITGTARKVEVEKAFDKGDKVEFAGYTVVNEGFRFDKDPRKEIVYIILDLYRGDEKVKTLKPAKFFYKPTLEGMEPQVTTEMGLYSTLREDLLFILLGYDIDDGIANIKLIKNPLVVWIWIGSFVLFIGTMISAFSWKGKVENENK